MARESTVRKLIYSQPVQQSFLPDKWRALIIIFVIVFIAVLLFAVASQPLGIITDILYDSYSTASGTNGTLPLIGNAYVFIKGALGAVVLFAIAFGIFVYASWNMRDEYENF